MDPYLKRLYLALDERGHKAPLPSGYDAHPDAPRVIVAFALAAKTAKLRELQYQTNDDKRLLESLKALERATAPENLDMRVVSAIRVLECFEHVHTALEYDVSLAARLAACVDEMNYASNLLVLYGILNGLTA
jgi:hypothetical protein